MIDDIQVSSEVMEKFADFQVPEEFISHLFDPFVHKSMDLEAPAWLQMEKKTNSTYLWRNLKSRIFLHDFFGLTRSQKSIEKNYSQQWLLSDIVSLSRTDCAPSPCLWNNRGYLACSNGLSKIYIAVLLHVLKTLNVHTVAEIGCGNGKNLFALSSLLGGVKFTGVELTRGGVEAAHGFKELRELPKLFAEFLPGQILDPNAFRDISIVRGNAKSLDFDSSSFEAVYTVLALEQMEEIRQDALSELVRASEKYVIMIEPFKNWNQTPLRKRYTRVNKYFQGRVEDLKAYGLDIIYADSPFPTKLALGVGIVVAKKTGA